MKILYVINRGKIATGAKTYQSIVIREISKRHEVAILENKKDLEKEWDVIHCLDIKHAPRWIIKAKGPILLDIHDYYWTKFYFFPCVDFPVRYILQKIRKPIYQKLIKKSDGIITHCNYVKERIIHLNKYLLPLSVEISKETPQIRRENLIVFCGRDYFRKGIATLMKAGRILKKEGIEFKIIVAGKEPIYSYFFAKLLSQGLPVIYYRQGLPRQKLIEYYKQAKVVCLPSWIEASPITILEAFANGVPVIASNVGGIPEFIQHKINGFLIKSGDYNAFAEYIKICFNNEDTTQKITANAYKFLTNYNISKMISNLEKIYDDLLKNNAKTCSKP